MGRLQKMLGVPGVMRSVPVGAPFIGAGKGRQLGEIAAEQKRQGPDYTLEERNAAFLGDTAFYPLLQF